MAAGRARCSIQPPTITTKNTYVPIAALFDFLIMPAVKSAWTDTKKGKAAFVAVVLILGSPYFNNLSHFRSVK